MKKILIALAVLLSVQVADAQMAKSPEAAKKAVETAKVAAENPKKATKVVTWLKLANSYMDAYNAPTGNLFLNTPRVQLEQMLALKKPIAAEQVEVDGTPYIKEDHGDKYLYFDAEGVLRIIEITKPVFEDALAGALEAFAKAAEVDVKGAKAKEILAGIELVGAKYFEEGMNKYTFGDMAKAAELVGKAADAVQTAPLSKVDNTYTYYAAYIYMQAGNFEVAKKYFEKCVEVGYYAEEGNLFPALAEVYMKLGDEEKGVETLQKGFELFPENANLLVGLINYYLPKEGGEADLLSLIEQAKKAMPDNASIYRVEGDIFKRIGDFEKAEAAYRQSIAITPEAPEAYISLGGFFIDRGNEFFNKGQETFDQKEYEALMEQYEQMLIVSLEPLEKAYALMPEGDFKREIANTIKSVCFVLRNKEAKYQEMYDLYNGYANN
jgi:tetratricopeptide (TPR) repeat protein